MERETINESQIIQETSQFTMNGEKLKEANQVEGTDLYIMEGLDEIPLSELDDTETKTANANYNVAVASGSWIFFICAGNSIFRMRSDANVGQMILYDQMLLGTQQYGQIRALQVYGEYLLFFHDSLGLCRIKMDGTDFRIIWENGYQEYCVLEDKIYFLNKNSIYQMNLDGSDIKEIIPIPDNMSLIHFAVKDDMIYYIGTVEPKMSVLCSFSISETVSKILYEYRSPGIGDSGFQIKDDKIYIVNKGIDIYNIKTSELIENYVIDNELQIHGITIQGDKIYYVAIGVETKQSGLYEVVNGKNKLILTSEKAGFALSASWFWCVSGGYLYTQKEVDGMDRGMEYKPIVRISTHAKKGTYRVEQLNFDPYKLETSGIFVLDEAVEG